MGGSGVLHVEVGERKQCTMGRVRSGGGAEVSVRRCRIVKVIEHRAALVIQRHYSVRVFLLKVDIDINRRWMQREGIEGLKERGVLLRRYVHRMEAGRFTISPTTKPMAVFVMEGNLEGRDRRVLLLKLAMACCSPRTPWVSQTLRTQSHHVPEGTVVRAVCLRPLNQLRTASIRSCAILSDSNHRWVAPLDLRSLLAAVKAARYVEYHHVTCSHRRSLRDRVC